MPVSGAPSTRGCPRAPRGRANWHPSLSRPQPA
jgi:hypothetical protein